MKNIAGWRKLEFGEFVTQSAKKPTGDFELRCVELEHVEPATGKLLGWREGKSSEGSKLSFRKDDVLFGKLRPYLRKAWLAQFDGMCSSEFWTLTSPANACDQRWLKQLVLSDLFSRATFASSGSKMPRADWSIVASYPFQLPTLSEQRKIADILTTWDDAIGKIDVLIDAKTRRKKALMQQLLSGKLRFPAFAKSSWKKVRMSEVLTRVFRPIEWTADKPLSLVSLRRRYGGLFRRPDVLGADYKTQDLHDLKDTDFLISKRQVVHGAWALVTPEFAGCHVSKEYTIFVNQAPDKLDMTFFAWLAQTPHMTRLARVASTGVHIEKLIFDPEVFLRESIRIPTSIEEQRRIAAILDTADDELKLLRTQRTALDQQKRGLMQRLLTGKLRVAV